MAKLRVSTAFLVERLLPGVKAEFVGVSGHDERADYVDLEIVGPDVPDFPMVSGVFTKDYGTMQPAITTKLQPA